jgi:Transposase DDE domain
MSTNCYSGLYDGLLPDKRLAKRLERSLSDLVSSGTAVVNKLATTHCSKTAFYRMLSNERFDHDAILEGSYRLCSTAVNSTHVLCIQDTTEFNYQGIKKKLTELDPDVGPTGVKAIAGFFCHPMLVVDADSPSIFGLSSTLIYNRSWNQKSKLERNYAQLPIEEKESFRWIRSVELSKESIPWSVQKTVIGDRESDIYEEFERVPDEKTHLLVRSRCDRNLSNNQKLYAVLDQVPVQGTSVVHISSNKKREARLATLDISFCRVSICAPSNYKGDKKAIELHSILVKEQQNSVPDGEQPILWRLLTTHTIQTIEQANQCIEWYKKRWLIEELFRVIKTKGFAIESSQLGSGAALKKLLAMTLIAALKIMQLKLALSDQMLHSQEVFNQQERDYLELAQRRVEGATDKQKNPYKKDSLAWATWTIARLAGWSGYKTHGPPGYITIKEGFDRLNQQMIGYIAFIESKDV